MKAICFFILLAVASAHAAGWRAGVARVVITPEEPMWMSGYASRNKPAEGTLTELWAKCLALEDSKGKRAVLITADLIGIGREDSLAVRREIGRRYKIPIEAVVLSTSHTHTGPVVGNNLRAMYFYDDAQAELVSAYAVKLRKTLVELVGSALKEMKPRRLEWGTGTTTFAVNRRNNPERDVPRLREENKLKGPVDHDVPVLSVNGMDGELRAVVCGYACHATVLSFYQWSGDWPGFAQIELEKRHDGVQAMVWAGCGGDCNPLPRRKVELAENYGRMLAEAVDECMKNGMKPLPTELTMWYKEIDLPYAKLPTREELKKATESKNRYEASRARLLLGKFEQDEKLDATYPYPVQTWRFGSNGGPTLVVLGGEVVVDYALRFKRELGKDTWVMAYANDVMAYIPSVRVLKEGGYEGGGAMLYYGLPSVWGEAVEGMIVGEVLGQVGVGQGGVGR